MNINEILSELPLSNRSRRKEKLEVLKSVIEQRFGRDAAKKFCYSKQMRTMSAWIVLGYRPKLNEKPVQAIAYIDRKDSEGNTVEKYPRTVFLYHFNQLQKFNNA